MCHFLSCQLFELYCFILYYIVGVVLFLFFCRATAIVQKEKTDQTNAVVRVNRQSCFTRALNRKQNNMRRRNNWTETINQHTPSIFLSYEYKTFYLASYQELVTYWEILFWFDYLDLFSRTRRGKDIIWCEILWSAEFA